MTQLDLDNSLLAAVTQASVWVLLRWIVDPLYVVLIWESITIKKIVHHRN